MTTRDRLYVGPHRTEVYFAIDVLEDYAGLRVGETVPVAYNSGSGNWVSAAVSSSDETGELLLRVSIAALPEGASSRGADVCFGSSMSFRIKSLHQGGDTDGEIIVLDSSGSPISTIGLGGPVSSGVVILYDDIDGERSTIGSKNVYIDPVNGIQEAFLSGGSGIPGGFFPMLSYGNEETDDLLVVKSTRTDGAYPLRVETRVYVPVGFSSEDPTEDDASGSDSSGSGSSGEDSSGSDDGVGDADVPSGNGNSGGLDTGYWGPGTSGSMTLRFRGTGEAFGAEAYYSGKVHPDGGEEWTVTFAMRQELVRSFIRKRALFIGSIWQPVKLPSRNIPVISGWSIDEDGPMATVRFFYELKVGAAYVYSSTDTDGGATEPVESTLDSISNTTVERPLSECKAIFGSSKVEDNAVVVEWCKKYIQANDPTLSKEDREDALENFKEALTESEGKDLSTFLASTNANAVLACLRAGQDSFLAPTPTATRTEVLNRKPGSVGVDVGKYSTPKNKFVTAGTWLLVSDDVRELSSGQYERVRTWQKAEIKSPTYES